MTTRKTTAATTKAASHSTTSTPATVKPEVEVKEQIVGAHKVSAATTLKYKPNPKRKNSKAWMRYETYQKARTFGEYQELNKDKQSIPDLKYDLSKGFVEIK